MLETMDKATSTFQTISSEDRDLIGEILNQYNSATCKSAFIILNAKTGQAETGSCSDPYTVALLAGQMLQCALDTGKITEEERQQIKKLMRKTID